MRKFSLSLYITGQTPRSEQAIANLQRICEERRDQCEIVIVDVLEQPELAEKDKIIATPTLIKSRPPPVRRIIGDLSDIQKVVVMLGLGARDDMQTRAGERS
jgi:circadian clock protein KaiB